MASSETNSERTRRILMGRPIAQDFEREGQQAVAREHRRRLVEGLVDRRLAAPQIGIIHAWQVVMDQRIGVHAFQRRCDAKRAVARHPKQVGAAQHKKRPQPLAARKSGVAHGAHQPVFGAVGRRQKLIQQAFDGPRIILKGDLEREVLLSGFGVQAYLNRSRQEWF